MIITMTGYGNNDDDDNGNDDHEWWVILMVHSHRIEENIRLEWYDHGPGWEANLRRGSFEKSSEADRQG